MQAIVKYVHAISPCHRDVDGPYPIAWGDLSTPEAARAWLKAHTGTSVPLTAARRLNAEDDGFGWVFFPMRKRGSVWWSVSIRLDVETVQAQAEACTCRNCQPRSKPAP